MRRSSTKTSNISSKCHSVVEMHLSYRYRGHRSEWRGQIFDRKFLNSCFCACAVKICQKLAYGVVKSPQFQSVHKKKSWTLNTMVKAAFRPEEELTLFLRMRTKNRQNIAKMYCDRRVIHLLQEIFVAEANGEIRFLTGSS